MNSDLYTLEFRDFKYLKSSPTLLNYINESSKLINLVQPFSDINDPNFVWPHRVEFLEQLLDLSQDTIYIVEPGELFNDHNVSRKFMVGEASIHTIFLPTLWEGNVAQPDLGVRITFDDISRIENSFGKDCFLCSAEYWTDKTKIPHVFRIRDILLLGLPNYTSIFYDEIGAEKYRLALTTFLRNNYDAVSAFSRLI